RRLALAGIYIDTGFIMLTPTSTLAEIRQKLAFLRQLPYFTPRAISSTLWPLHGAGTTGAIRDDLLLVDDKKISLSFKFADKAVERYHVLVSALRQAFDGFYGRIYWSMRDHMREDPAIVHRFGAAMRDLLGVLLEIASTILDGIERDRPFGRLEDTMWKRIDQKSPYVADLATNFQ